MAFTFSGNKAKGPARDQHQGRDLQAAMKLFGLTIAPANSSASASASANASAATGSAAAPEVSTKLADDVRSNDGIPCLPNKSLNIGESLSGLENAIKKPNMTLHCPRCNSENTKFCYFNNYTVNQPRHQCRNCKKYWTHGGAMRDEGSSRRIRNKQPSNHLHATNQHVLPSSAEETEAMATSESEVVLSLSLSSVHNTKEQKNNTNLVSLGSGDNKEEKSCLSSAVVSDSSENSMPKKKAGNILGYGTGMKELTPHTQRNPAGPALVYPYTGSNSAPIRTSTQFLSYGTLMENGVANLLALLPPGIRAPAVPFPQVSLLGNRIPSWANGAWSAPWPGISGTALTSLPPNGVAGSGSGSLTLGKHPREANSQEEEKAENTLWFPKALRITDPEEAAKSTIWESLGIKPDERIFSKSSHSKDKKGKTPESPHAL